ncbi:MAG TPA: SDR family oxidoreductase [Actinomycetales bacterium]|nr:SDR family oxidoreductase [Actinomycetales bacterium]
MTLPDLVVTGSTGRLGSRVAGLLAAAGVPQRLLVRDESRAPRLPGAEVVQADYGDADAALRALDGARTLFMVSAAEAADRLAQHRTFVEAASRAGVERVVYTSFAGAAADATFTLARDHHATEEMLTESPMAWTALRDSLYLDFLPLMVGADGVIRGPAGGGRVAAVAIADLAEVAATVLQHPGDHEGAVYVLTGPKALTLDEVAAQVGAATGRQVRYERETVEEAYASRAHYGAPAWQLDAWVSTYTAIAAGEMAEVSDHIEQVTGHPATSLAQLLDVAH